MFKRAAHTLAIALLFAGSVIPVIHGFSTGSKPASGVPVVVAVSGTDPEPPTPGMMDTILAFLHLS
jgi:hypothetical protein